MNDFKTRWEIQKNWQLIYPFLGSIGLLLSGYFLAKVILKSFSPENTTLLIFLTLLLGYIFLNITLRLFKKLAIKWNVEYRWELIAIFLVFAITGSTSAQISGPILEAINLKELISNSFLFWTIRILIIFPIYQVMLVMVGWVFGQFPFFWAFEKKMLKRMGFKRFFNE